MAVSEIRKYQLSGYPRSRVKHLPAPRVTRSIHRIQSLDLRHIYIERAHKGATIRLFVAGASVRVVRDDGQLLRELTLDPSRDNQSRRATRVDRDK
ncbi:MAG TPA: hypothetical protein VI056_09110 [Candidatus Limnocylindria bacterium]